MKCPTINSNARYKKVRDKQRHLANRNGLPDHMVNAIANLMEGKEIDWGSVPRHARRVYKEQDEIGWRNMTLGRITQRWSKVRQIDAKKKAGPGKKWRTKGQ